MAVIAGNTPVFFVNGRGARVRTRVGGREYNRYLKSFGEYGPILGREGFTDAEGNLFVPSKGLEWDHVTAAIREGKKVQAKLDRPKAK